MNFQGNLKYNLLNYITEFEKFSLTAMRLVLGIVELNCNCT